MKILKPRSLVARLVTAGTAGLLIAIGLFAVLSHIIDVPFVTTAVAHPAPDYRPGIVDTPLEVTPPPRIPKPEKPEPPDVLTPREISDDPVPEDRTIERGAVTRTLDLGREGVDGVGRVPGFGYSGGTDQETVKLFGMPPEYPARQLIQGVEGWVRVRFTITATGSVRDASVVAAEPRGAFDAAALAAIARWRYNPRIVDGVAVERVGVETLIEFELAE